jgi:ABC-2 type transport system permease protein
VTSGVGSLAAPRAGRVKAPGVGSVYRWELTKLRFQKRTYLGLGASAIVPILFVIALQVRHDRHGGDFAFASYLTRSGLAVPLVIMLFGAVWMFPLITALVAGDIFASEDHNGTLKTILTRSLERHQIFAGKLLAAVTYAVVAIVLDVTVAVIAGCLESGFNSLQSLSGTIVSAPKSLELVYGAMLVYLIPIATIGGDPQQRCGSSWDVDGLAAVSADRRASGHGGHAAVSAQHPVQRLAGAATHAD